MRRVLRRCGEQARRRGCVRCPIDRKCGAVQGAVRVHDPAAAHPRQTGERPAHGAADHVDRDGGHRPETRLSALTSRCKEKRYPAASSDTRPLRLAGLGAG